MYDIVIIGAGIIGTMLARDLSAFHLETAVIEKNSDVADGTTMANSAIVHTGYDPEEGTLKAKLNVQGARLYPKLCQDLACHYKTVGALIAACGKEEEKHLDILAQRADERGIPYRRYDGNQAGEVEPGLSENVTAVLDFHTTAVIYPWEVAISCMENAMNNGTQLYLNETVTSIDSTDNGYCVHTDHRDFETRMVINCAGICSASIHDMITTERDFTITPRKGEYYVLDQDARPVSHIVFPVPGPKGKGVLAVPTVYGNTLIGPNAMDMEDQIDVSTTYEGLAYVRQAISKTIANVPWNGNIRTFAGLRASSSRHDFIIEEVKGHPGFIDVCGIESPGLASAPAISQYIVNTFVIPCLEPEKNESACMTLQPQVYMNELSDEEKNAKILSNPLYAKIICRCENISEQEIIDCIHRPCGARSIKGVKKRVRPGMGRCQGGFCEPRVLSILARELGISVMDVCLDGPGSEILRKENR